MLYTFAGPVGPSSFDICSLACLGRSTVFVRGRRPNRNDIFAVVTIAPTPSSDVYGRGSKLEDWHSEGLCKLAINSDIRKSKACANIMARSRGSWGWVAELMRTVCGSFQVFARGGALARCQTQCLQATKHRVSPGVSKLHETGKELNRQWFLYLLARPEPSQ
jgi:hypothetical protein